MSHSNGEPAEGTEPSMEDILASIRRILNDDAEPAPEQAAVPAVSEPLLSAPVEDDVFELDHSMIVEEPGEPQMMSAPQEPEPAPQNEAPRHPPPDDEPLLAPSAAAAASASMGALVRVLGQRQTPVYHGGPSLEDIVRDELRPILKNWLDENLAPLVERTVRAEIERLTRNGL